MQQAGDSEAARGAPSELEDFLASVGDENAAEGRRRRGRDTVLGLLALPVLFIALVAAIVWLVPVVAARLPEILDYVALLQAGG